MVGWVAKSTLGNWIWTFQSGCRTICSVFQAEVMTIYWAFQWILAYGVPFTHIFIFSNSQAAIKFLSKVANNSGIIRECRDFFNLQSMRFSVTFILVHGYCNIPRNFRADEIARNGGLLRKFSWINLGMPLSTFKLAIKADILPKRQPILNLWGVLFRR